MNWSEQCIQHSSYLNIGTIVAYAQKVKATDIHIINDSKPIVRINKELEDIQEFDYINEQMVSSLVEDCIKYAGNDELLVTLKAVGEIDFSMTIEPYGRYRVSIYRQKGCYSIAMRVNPIDVPRFDELGLPHQIRQLITKKRGLVLVTGSTGSGKSTTLASLINEINLNQKLHIITIEDPIEYLHTHKQSRINQREVGSDTESFASALRAALREDPDVILVGEMRDYETISIALTAAETGHLIFSTLHTVGASKTIDRIVDNFPGEQQIQVRNQIATVLNGVVSQELIKKEDGSGLVPACEVMFINPAIQNLIRENKTHQIINVLQTNLEEGMQTLDHHLLELVASHVISKDEAIKKCQDPNNFTNFLDRGGKFDYL